MLELHSRRDCPEVGEVTRKLARAQPLGGGVRGGPALERGRRRGVDPRQQHRERSV